jgi:hypothetical protein
VRGQSGWASGEIGAGAVSAVCQSSLDDQSTEDEVKDLKMKPVASNEKTGSKDLPGNPQNMNRKLIRRLKAGTHYKAMNFAPV